MTRFHRWFLYGSTIATAASGITYFVMKRFFESSDPWAVINHPLEPWALKLHILSAPLMLFAVGLITTQHIWRSLRSSLPTGRHSGRIASYVFVPLVLSGYSIQAITSPLTLEVLAWAHLALGLVAAGAIGVHRMVLHTRRRQRKGALPVLQLPAQLESADTDPVPDSCQELEAPRRARSPSQADAHASRSLTETPAPR
jgi:hypothetical protein